MDMTIKLYARVVNHSMVDTNVDLVLLRSEKSLRLKAYPILTKANNPIYYATNAMKSWFVLIQWMSEYIRTQEEISGFFKR